MTTQDELKKAAAAQALTAVQPDMVLGIGSGTTVDRFIDALGAKVAAGQLKLAGLVTTSVKSRRRLAANGLTVGELADFDHVDLTVDGANRVAANLDGIKGGGGSLTQEKNVAVYSTKNLWIVDASKIVTKLGGFPLPVEVLPISAEQVANRLASEGLAPSFRLQEDGKRFVTDNGNFILDLNVSPLPVPAGLADYLDHVVGVVEHGLFLGICDEVLIAQPAGTIDRRVRA